MSVHAPTTPRFKQNAKEALANTNIQAAMGAAGNFAKARASARAEMPEFDDLRDSARDLKNQVLANLADYLEQYEANVLAAGGHVHWAETAEDARERAPGGALGQRRTAAVLLWHVPCWRDR